MSSINVGDVASTNAIAHFPAIRACLFDVDGLLIDSEDIYTGIYNNVLREYGKPDLPWSVKAKQQSRGRAVGAIMLQFLMAASRLSAI